MMEKLRQQWQRTPVTLTLLFLMSTLFLAMQILCFGRSETATAVYEFGGIFGFFLKGHPEEMWRVLSPLFVHVGWEHFILNMLFLFLLGNQVEQVLGKWKFLTVFLLSGILGNLVAAALTPDTVIAGASGALYGLSAMMALLYYRVRSPYLRQIGQIQQAFLLSGLVLSLLTLGVSLAGHFGGALGGLLCGVFVSITGENTFTKTQRFLALLAYVFMTLFLLAHLVM